MQFFNFTEILSQIYQQSPSARAVVEYRGKGLNSSMNYLELTKRSTSFSAVLKSAGLSQGDAVGIFMKRSCEHVACLVGIARCGGIFFCIHPKFSAVQIGHALHLTGAKILVADNTTLIRLSSGLDLKIGKSLTILHIKDGPMHSVHENAAHKLASVYNYRSIDFTDAEFEEDTDEQSLICPNDVAMVLFTSGTTGVPKGVMISHLDLVRRAKHEILSYQLTPNDVLLNLLTFSFDVGCNQLFSSLLSGACLVINNSWLNNDIISSIREHHVTGISGVPSIWNEMMNFDEKMFSDVMKGVRYITISGGDMPTPKLQRLHQILSATGTGIYKTYGQTETFRSSMLFPHEFETKMRSVGRPWAEVDVKIIDDNGNVVPPGNPGEVVHRGLGVMCGYLGDPIGTEKKFSRVGLENKDEVPTVYTGDEGMLDHDGYLFLLGRRDKMIKIMGNRVYPQEILNQVSEHNEIAEAAVFSIKNENGEPQIWMEVRLKSGSTLSDKVLQTFLMQRLPSYMVPSRIFFVPDFPRTESGKISLSAIEAKYLEKN